MSVWDFEASLDGITWDTLHQARDDRHARNPTIDQRRQLEKRLRDSYGIRLNEVDGGDILTRECHLFAEKELRGTWALEPVPSKFYQYFQFIGIGDDAFDALNKQYVVDDLENDEACPQGCMHGVGLEIFGDIQEI